MSEFHLDINGLSLHPTWYGFSQRQALMSPSLPMRKSQWHTSCAIACTRSFPAVTAIVALPPYFPWIHQIHNTRQVLSVVVPSLSLLFHLFCCFDRNTQTLCLLPSTTLTRLHRIPHFLHLYASIALYSIYSPSKTSRSFIYTMRLFSAAAALLAAVPFTQAYWKGFNVAAENPDGSCKTQAQWVSAFQKLSSLPGHFTSVRLYASSDCNTLALAVPAAISTGTQLLVGVWTQDDAHFKREKDALESAIKRYGQDWIIAISVGSEDLYRKEVSAGTLATKIYDVRGMVRAMGVKKDVGHVDTWTAWVDSANTEVIKASDFIGLGKLVFERILLVCVSLTASRRIPIL